MNLGEVRYLVVEDHGFQRWLTGNVLAGLGAHDVFYATNGREALDVLAAVKRRIDVVITDLDVPGMDGKAFIHHVGQAGHPLSLILLRGHDRSLASSVEAIARAHGVRLLGEIEKPVTAKKLQAILHDFEAHPPVGEAPKAQLLGTSRPT